MKNKYHLTDDHLFTYEEIIKLLDEYTGKTLGEADKDQNGCYRVFQRAVDNPKITGIAGDVVEQSILGYKPDSDQRPDIIVDGIPVEVKTTGIRMSKKKGEEHRFEAKEPMSITAVSPATIVTEKFDTSHFWEKLEHMLLVYYLYNADKPVKAMEYANFKIKGYEFHEFEESDKRVLENDWNLVKSFIDYIQKNYSNPELEYPRLSSELRDVLMYIDTAPKWPNPPRFRLKRSFVTSIVQSHFESKLEKLPEEYDSFKEFDEKLHQITEQFSGKTVEELLNYFAIEYKDINHLNKAISEQIIIKMFGGKSSKLNQIELFEKVGIIAKTICLTNRGGRTEDMKMFGIDFKEWCDDKMVFEDSFVYDYFANHQILCIVFEEKDENQNFKDNKFKGFKRLSFDEDFIENEVRKTWNEIRKLVNQNLLKEETVYKKDGSIKMNKTGIPAMALNFPKSKDYVVFVRGSGLDSSHKPLVLNGIRMYEQCLWLKGSFVVKKILEKPFI